MDGMDGIAAFQNLWLILPILTDEHQSLLSRDVLLALLPYALISALLVLALVSMAYGLLATLWFLASLPGRIHRRLRGQAGPHARSHPHKSAAHPPPPTPPSQHWERGPGGEGVAPA